MEKIKVIIGPGRVGKTRLAKQLAERYEKEEVCFFSIRHGRFNEDPFFLAGCTEQTKLIIFDDARDVFALKQVLEIAYSEKLRIDEPCKAAFMIDTPEIIITCDEKVTAEHVKGKGFVRGRIELIKLGWEESW